MALKFKYDPMRRIVDRIMIWMLRYDLAPERYYLLTVKGRKSGLPRSKPVALVEEDGQRWLIAPYGDVNWVRNARATYKVSPFSRAQFRGIQDNRTIARRERSDIEEVREPLCGNASIFQCYTGIRTYRVRERSPPASSFQTSENS